MFDLSAVQILIVLIIALVVFGPKRLPELGRQLGKGIHDLRKHATAVTREFTRPAEDEPTREVPAAATALDAPPSTADESDEDLLAGVVVARGTMPDDEPAAPARPAQTAPPAGETDEDLLAGVVVPGDTPPASRPAR